MLVDDRGPDDARRSMGSPAGIRQRPRMRGATYHLRLRLRVAVNSSEVRRHLALRRAVRRGQPAGVGGRPSTASTADGHPRRAYERGEGHAPPKVTVVLGVVKPAGVSRAPAGFTVECRSARCAPPRTVGTARHGSARPASLIEGVSPAAIEATHPASAPGRSRTCDLEIRRLLLYPAELQGPGIARSVDTNLGRTALWFRPLTFRSPGAKYANHGAQHGPGHAAAGIHRRRSSPAADQAGLREPRRHHEYAVRALSWVLLKGWLCKPSWPRKDAAACISYSWSSVRWTSAQMGVFSWPRAHCPRHEQGI